MAISLYAHGPAVIEIGKYGMTLEKAKESFLETCKEFKITAEVKEKKGELIFDLQAGEGTGTNLGELLSKLAEIEDLHSDFPDIYSLKDEGDVPEGEYVKTGSYND